MTLPTDLHGVIGKYLEPRHKISCLKYNDYVQTLRQKKDKVHAQDKVTASTGHVWDGCNDEWISILKIIYPGSTICLYCIYLDSVPYQDYVDLDRFDPEQFIKDVRAGKHAVLENISSDTLVWDADANEMSSLYDKFVVTGRAIEFILQWLDSIKSQTPDKSVFIIK